jgi:epsin
MDFLKKGLSKVKDKVSQADLEKKLVEATPNETGMSNISLLNEISSRTDDSEECKIVVKYCLKLLTLKPKLWKKILRDLNLIEHVIKTGSQNFIEQIKEERDKLRDLNNFTYEEDDKDRGEQSKYNYIFK